VIRQYVQHPANLSKNLRQMEQNGLISAAGGGYRLTEAGEKEARQVLRAHRLWETYLESIGTPKEALHPTAHRLEHIRAEGTVDYLDEKLGRPAWDPHGKKIPPRQENGNQK
jgi:manganese/iron transport system permease protein/iron/zinc/copper transport system permease protein